MFYSLIKPLLFSLSPERAHDMTLSVAKLSPTLGKLSGMIPHERLSMKVGSLDWKFPVGLAAGLDKNAEALDFFSGQGFGAIESGTITLKPQVGNPRPRLWRYPEEASLRNAMGFPNHGLLSIIPRVKNFDHHIPLGANIGKNKDTSAKESIEELTILLETLIDDIDYFVINVSSPNTPGLRALQEKNYLSELFSELNKSRNGKDLYLKISPDLDKQKVRELTHLVHDYKLTGIIATNTTIMTERGGGGVSGKLLAEKARTIRKTILDENLPIELIGVGGISSAQDLFDLWKDGGKAAQIYTAYIFQGPEILKNIQKDVLAFLDNHQIKKLENFFDLSLAERKSIINGDQ